MIRTARAIEQDVLPPTSNLLFAFSWMLVMAIGLVPLVTALLYRSPSITLPMTIAFFVAMGARRIDSTFVFATIEEPGLAPLRAHFAVPADRSKRSRFSDRWEPLAS